MENATKALVMAGAILVAIILIGTGITILKSVKGPADQAGKTADVISAAQFNSQFTTYIGQNMSAQHAKELISRVQASNGTHQDHKIDYIAGSVTTLSDIDNSKRYTISSGTDQNGYINAIKIAPINSGGGQTGRI